jgi:hypothetical protein
MEEKIRVSAENYSWLKKQLVMWQEKSILTEEQNIRTINGTKIFG